MNGFTDHGLDEKAFGAAENVASKLRTFDAFPKTKPSYTAATRRGGQWTVFTLVFCLALAFSELRSWYNGEEFHHFSVEKGVGRELQFNVDMVVKIPCGDVIVDLRDAAGDDLMAEKLLSRETTSWDAWIRDGVGEYQTLREEDLKRLADQEEDQHVGHVLGEVRRSLKKKFPKGPKLKRGDSRDACRVYGSLVGNKVQGGLHITSKQNGFIGVPKSPNDNNFSHLITELSFGPHYSSLLNPLDKTVTTTQERFKKYQYYLSVVPTIYTKSKIMDPYTQTLPDPSSITSSQRKNTVFTNQYAVTEHSQALKPTPFVRPGIFFRYNIEPILLVVSEERGSLLALLVRLTNVAAGVVVAGGWVYKMSMWAVEVLRKRQKLSQGVLTGKHAYVEDE